MSVDASDPHAPDPGTLSTRARFSLSSCVIAMARRPGRPSIDDSEACVQVGLTLPQTQYDRYARQALREQVSIPEIIRRELRRALPWVWLPRGEKIH